MIAYSKGPSHGLYAIIKPRSIKLPKRTRFQHPKDLKVILAYLLSHGSLYCDYETVESLYQDFSKKHGRYWLDALSFKFKLKKGESDPILYEFSTWMDGRHIDDKTETACSDIPNLNCSCIDVSIDTDSILMPMESVVITHRISKDKNQNGQTETLEVTFTACDTHAIIPILDSSLENYDIKTNTSTKTNKFDVVEKIPKGYGVWNIGQYMGTDDYIPLIPNGQHGSSFAELKAIRLPKEDVYILREAASHGVANLNEAEECLTHRSSYPYKNLDIVIASKALKIFKRISH